MRTARRIWASLLPYERRSATWQIVADTLMNLLDIAAIALLFLMVRCFAETAGQDLFSRLIRQNPPVSVAFLLLLFMAKNLAGYYISATQFRFAYQVSGRVSSEALLHYLEGKYHDFILVDSAVQIRKISQQPIEFAHYILGNMQLIISQGVLILLSVAAITWYDAKMFLLLSVVFVPPVALLLLLIRRKTADSKLNAKKSSELSLQLLKEALNGFVEAKIFNSVRFLQQRYVKEQRKLNHHLAGIQVFQTIPTRTIEVFIVAVVCTMLLLKQPGGTASLISMGAFMAAAYKIIPGVVRILNAVGLIRIYRYSIPEVVESSAVTPATGWKLRSFEFNDISFQFNGKRLIRDFSLNVAPGDLVGISGRSGGGKTSILNLLLGFHQPQSGRVHFNNLNEQDAALVQHATAYAKQQPFLIHDSILKNIILEDEVCDPERLRQVCLVAGVGNGEHALDLDAVITESGKNISGGQRQRIALARALYKNADLLVLDEPFSELDKDSEASLLRHLQALSTQGKMILLVTHNPEALKYCNKIVSLDEA